MKKILSLLILSFFLYSKEFIVATYNVENFFDLKYNGSEYNEFIPNKNSWNKRAYYKKLFNITKVIKDIKADIIGLEEIENDNILKTLQIKCGYKYRVFTKKRDSAIGLGILSNYPIIKKNIIKVDRLDAFVRDILKVIILIDNKQLIIYLNHWKSKRGGEKNRIVSAIALKEDILNLPKYSDYIVMGDFNSNYDEFLSIKFDKKLNDSYGLTAINDILNTTVDNKFVNKKDIFKYDFAMYNLWLELPPYKRCSYQYRGACSTPDNMLISAGLLDKNNISYVDSSFKVFDKRYLFRGKYIKRWNIKKKFGYSDHLPIYAKFSTNYKDNFYEKKYKITNISDLYKINGVDKVLIKNICIISKYKNSGIVKQIGDRAIFVYKALKGLKEGECYDMNIYQINDYYTKEITSLEIIKFIKTINPATMFINGNRLNIFDENKINDIVYINGFYKNGYLYFNNKKIKLYFKKWVKKPKNNNHIVVKKGVLQKYKGRFEIVIYGDDDFMVR